MIHFPTIWFIINASLFRMVQAEDCGGELPASPSGELHNPDVDGDFKYEDNTECIWTITADFDRVIEVEFYYMELEDSASCLYDYVQVYDGEIGDFLMGQFCGTTTPEPLSSSGNVITIRFKSDASTTFYGFGIVYFERNGTGLSLCGPIQNSLAGTIASIDGDSNGFYDDDVTCTWKINFPGFYKKIQLYFLKMALQVTDLCQGDYVKVSDAKTVYGVFCGSDTPQLITSTANDLFIEFVSNNETHDEGFLAVYSAIDDDLQCGAIVTKTSGYIVSTDRDGDGEYDVDLQCVWVIAAPIGKGIELIFTDIDIESDDECSFDSLEMFDGSFTEESSLGRVCGDVIPVNIKTVSNLLFLEFYSDDSITYGGFKVSYQHTEGQKLCGPFQTHLGGELALVDAISDESINCTWKIELTNTDKVIELYLIIFDIPATDGCTADHIKVYDADATYGIFCGTNETHTIISNSNVLNVNVIKAGEASGNEVSGYYSTRDLDHQCGGILSSQTGIVRSVDRDQNGEYDPDLFCVWGIVAPPGMRIKLETTDFGTELSAGCYYDYLKIVDGVYKSSSSTEERFCGNNAPETMISKSTTLFLVMETDSSTQRKGFLANYIFIDASDIQTTVETTVTSITYKWIDLTGTGQTETTPPSVGSTINNRHTTEETGSNMTSTKRSITTDSDQVTTSSDDATSLTDVSITLSDVTTSLDDITTLSDNVKTPFDDITTLSDNVTTPFEDITTLSDDITTPSDRVTTSSDGVTAWSDNVTSSSDNVTIETKQTSPHWSTTSEEKHTSVQTSSKTMNESTARTTQITTSKEMTSTTDGANLTTVWMTSDTSPTTERVTETNITTVSAMSEMDKSIAVLNFCLFSTVLFNMF